MTPTNNPLEEAIQYFHAEITPGLHALAEALDEAGISHYSSGCGVKRVTFDIFPASHNVLDMISMVSLDRNYRANSDTGLRDVSKNDQYSPANQFMQYLRRWQTYSEQVMQNEGDAPRGVAAARAKLIIEELMETLAPKPAIKAGKLGSKIASSPNFQDFFVLMRAIGLNLESSKKADNENRTVTAKERMEQNFKKALAAATGKKYKADSFLAA